MNKRLGKMLKHIELIAYTMKHLGLEANEACYKVNEDMKRREGIRVIK